MKTTEDLLSAIYNNQLEILDILRKPINNSPKQNNEKIYLEALYSVLKEEKVYHISVIAELLNDSGKLRVLATEKAITQVLWKLNKAGLVTSPLKGRYSLKKKVDLFSEQNNES